MTQEERQLLLKDLCARLTYGIIVSIPYPTFVIGEEYKKLDIPLISIDLADNTCAAGDLYGKTSGLRMFNRKGELLCKPYLRPMSSMTEEERKEFYNTMDEYTHRLYPNSCDWSEHTEYSWTIATFDWLNKKMFDYRGLIQMGFALEAPENMYNTKTK